MNLFDALGLELSRKYPSFDKYPRYMQDALLTNEHIQGRLKK